MVAIYHQSQIPSFSEARAVRLIARALAVALAVVAIVLVSRFEIETVEDGLGAPVVNVFLSAPQTPPPRPHVIRSQRPETESDEAVLATTGEADDWPHLWTYDAQGRIVLRTDEQLVRCTSARRQGREEADCPDSTERTPMISRES